MMTVTLTLDIKLRQPQQPIRILTGQQLLEQHAKLRADELLLKTIMIDNFGCNLEIGNEVVARCTFMYDGRSSPDMLQLYEQHLSDLFEQKSVTVNFYEEMAAWRFIPEGDEMVWQVLDATKGHSNTTVKREGRCARLPFINAAFAWLQQAIAILELYQNDLPRETASDIAGQIDMAKRLLTFSRHKLAELGWQ